MTRYKKKKSIGLIIVTVLIVAMVMGFTDLTAENEADTLVYEFGVILEGVKTEVLSIPNDTNPSVDTTDTIQTGKILSDTAYIEAFDEVIRKQNLKQENEFQKF